MIKFEKLVIIFKISTSLCIFFYQINITVLFFQNTVIYLHRTHCRIYVLISPKSNKKIVVHSYHDNILTFKKGQLFSKKRTIMKFNWVSIFIYGFLILLSFLYIVSWLKNKKYFKIPWKKKFKIKSIPKTF